VISGSSQAGSSSRSVKANSFSTTSNNGLYSKVKELNRKEYYNESRDDNNNQDSDIKKNRVAVFLDGSNFFYMQKDALNWFIDPKKLLNWIKQFGDVTDANYYTTVDNQNQGQVNYIRALNHMGFRVDAKPIDSYEDSDEGFDGSVDLDMLIDILVQMENYDMAVIISGDADFARIVEVLRQRGKKYLVLSTKGMVSGAVKSAAGLHYKDIAELRSKIEKN